MSDLTRLNPTPHAIAVYASSSLSPVITQHSLPSGRCPLLAPDFHRLDRTSLPGALIQSPRRLERADWFGAQHAKEAGAEVAIALSAFLGVLEAIPWEMTEVKV